MSEILTIYQQYTIPHWLQDHMLAVAGVAALMCDAIKGDIKKEHVISACLLHDMGNIIKFDFNYTTTFAQGKELEYWKDVQQEFIQKYGTSAHHGTMAIAKEIGVSDYTLGLMDAIGFDNACKNYKQTDIHVQICAYSDLRVAPPDRVVSLNDRLEDLHIRYRKHPRFKEGDDNDWDEKDECIRRTEETIFERASITPEDVLEEDVRGRIPELKFFNLI